MASPSFAAHDHGACISDAITTVERLCLEKRLQLTPIRRRVLELLLQEHRAMGAYEILDLLRDEGHAAQPPVAYRALDFLVVHRFAHRIERLNAFIACSHPGEAHHAAFLICRECSSVAETQIVDQALDRAAQKVGFSVEATVVEAEGLCPNCQG